LNEIDRVHHAPASDQCSATPNSTAVVKLESLRGLWFLLLMSGMIAMAIALIQYAHARIRARPLAVTMHDRLVALFARVPLPAIGVLAAQRMAGSRELTSGGNAASASNPRAAAVLWKRARVAAMRGANGTSGGDDARPVESVPEPFVPTEIIASRATAVSNLIGDVEELMFRIADVRGCGPRANLRARA
jgi:hypothetical protein